MDNELWGLIIGSGGLVTLIGYILKNKQETRTATTKDFEVLSELWKKEFTRLDERITKSEAIAKEAEEKAEALEDENERLIEENTWYRDRVESLEARVDELEKDLEIERSKL